MLPRMPSTLIMKNISQTFSILINDHHHQQHKPNPDNLKVSPPWYYHVSQPASHHLTRNGQNPRLDPYMFEYALYLTTAAAITIIIIITIIKITIIIAIIMTNHHHHGKSPDHYCAGISHHCAGFPEQNVVSPDLPFIYIRHLNPDHHHHVHNHHQDLQKVHLQPDTLSLHRSQCLPYQ